MSSAETESGVAGWARVLRWRGFVWVAIPLLWAMCYLPGLTARDLRLEEGRRATPAQEMLDSGNYVVPTLYGEPYLNKPPLYFWIVATFGKLFGGVNELAVRLPSVLSVLLGAWLLVGFGKQTLTREIRVLGSLVFMSMPIILDKGTLGEIDALLSVLVFGAIVSIWWGFDDEEGEIRAKGWLVAGLFLGAAGLLKGPPGLVEFYGVVLPFLIFVGGGRWRALFSIWHLAMLVLALAPVAGWVWALLAHTGMGIGGLAKLWGSQLGGDAVRGADGSGTVGSHYLLFEFRVVAMLLPWIIFGFAGMLRGFGKQAGLQGRARDLWVLLAVSGPTLLAIFWAWPAATPRHMMMVAMPVSALVGLVLATSRAWEKWPKLIHLLHGAAGVMAIGIGVVGIVSVVLAIIYFKAALVMAIILAAAALVIAIAAVRITLKTPARDGPLAFGCTLAILMIVGRGAVAAVFLPYKAQTDSTHLVHMQIEELVPTDLPVYTTRTLSEGKGGNYFNIQFYLRGAGQGAEALKDFAKLPSGQTVTVVIDPSELDELRQAIADVKVLGTIKGAGVMADLLVVRARRDATGLW